MRRSFQVLSVLAVIFGISGMAYYYHSIHASPASLTAQAAASESAQEATTNTIPTASDPAPYWQKTYPSYDKGVDNGEIIPSAWGWPNPLTADISLPVYHPVHSYFDAIATNDRTQGVIVRDTLFPDSVYSDTHTQTETGSLSVAPNTEVTLEWACSYYQSTTEYRCDNTMCKLNYLYYVRVWPNPGPKGTNFNAGTCNENTGCPNLGRTTVIPQQTTTYTLTCQTGRIDGINFLARRWFLYNGSWQPGSTLYTPPTNAVMKITVEVNTCDGKAPSSGTNTYKLEAGKEQSINVTIGAKTYKYCISNPTALSYLVPAGSEAEMDKFIAAIPSLGLTIK